MLLIILVLSITDWDTPLYAGNAADSDESSDTSKRMVNQDDYHKDIKVNNWFWSNYFIVSILHFWKSFQ